MTYAEAIQFLYGLQIFGANFGLENTRKLAALVGNPQDKLRFIHVAGTNGKGSTCAMLESIYRAAGLRVGLFTSPHLVSFRERIQINRQLILESELVRLVEEIQPLLKQFPADNHLTLFEVVTVMALKFFAEQRCDLVIWETGLGGRLDATSIVTPLTSVITNIALDHQQWLGDTLEKIAAEKAGIIKPGVPVATATDAPEALAVIEKIAREKNAPLTIVGRDAALRRPDSAARCLYLSLLGDHQQTNATLALVTAEVLQKQIPVAEEKIRVGLANVNWPGRLQLIEKPDGQKILLDGAHNVAGAEALRAALKKILPERAQSFIFGAFWGTSNGRKFATRWHRSPPKFSPCRSPANARRTEANWQTVFRSANPAAKVFVCDSLKDAFEKNGSRGRSPYQAENLIVVTGSLYLVGEALERLGLSPATTGERGLNEWSAAR